MEKETEKRKKSLPWWLIKETLSLGVSDFAAVRKVAVYQGDQAGFGVTMMCSWVSWGMERSKVSSSPFYLLQMSLKQQPMKAAPLGLSRFSVSQHGRTWRSCRFPVSRFSGSDCSCPVRGQCLIYKEYQGSLNSTFFCASQTQHFISKITGFVLSCLESYRHFSSAKLQWDQWTNTSICVEECGCLSLQTGLFVTGCRSGERCHCVSWSHQCFLSAWGENIF